MKNLMTHFMRRLIHDASYALFELMGADGGAHETSLVSRLKRGHERSQRLRAKKTPRDLMARFIR